MTHCVTCQLVERRDAGEAPDWDAIVRTDHWDVVHSFNTALEGWLVLVTRQHRNALAELSEGEAAELGPLAVRVSQALLQVSGCEKTYLAQFAEHPDHRHVHVHLIPRGADHPADAIGPNVFRLIGESAADRITDDRMDELARALRRALAPFST